MYKVPYFKAKNSKEVIEFIYQNKFVTICGFDDEGFPVATHIPIVIEEKNDKIFIQGHFMRNQKHTLAFEKNNKVLVIFLSQSHCYISATNYKKQNTASTYNYQAVHCKGIIKFMNDDELYMLLTKLTRQFETNENSKALVEKMDKDYVSENMKAIIGFEIELIEIEHIFKLSQNKSNTEKENIISNLNKSGDVNLIEMANLIKKSINH